VLAAPAQAAPPAPGDPGDRHTWTAADKHGFGTATQPGSHTRFTLRSAELMATIARTANDVAWSIEAGEPIERPSIVACRYTGEGCG
jgi:Glucodextranase, domain N